MLLKLWVTVWAAKANEYPDSVTCVITVPKPCGSDLEFSKKKPIRIAVSSDDKKCFVQDPSNLVAFEIDFELWR